MKLLSNRTHRVALALILSFGISRIIFYLIGIRYDASQLGTFWQFLDPTLLRNRLAESLVHFHSQPPLYNLFLGIVLKLAPVHYPMVFHAVYLLLGVSITLCSFYLMLALGLSRRWAFRLTLLFALSPSSIVFENWLFYDYPLAALFLFMTLFLYRFARSGKVFDGVLFFSTLSIVVLTRSLFHLAWVFAVVGLLYYSLKSNRRQVLYAAMVPMLIICCFATRNYVMFGSISGSSWFGQHVARVTTAEIPEVDRENLVRQGKLTPLALIPAFTNLGAYPREFWANQHTGIPALDDSDKASGAPNFNNQAYIEISKRYQKDAMYVAVHYPQVVLVSIFKSAFFFLRSPNEFYMLRMQNEKMAPYETFFRRVFYGELRDYPEHATKQFDPNFQEHVLESTPIVMLFLIPMILIFGVVSTVRAYRRGESANPRTVTIAFIALNLLYVSVIANIFEMGENNRIRFMMDPLFLVMAALLGQYAFAALRSLETKRPQVAQLMSWTRKLEPKFAREFRIL